MCENKVKRGVFLISKGLKGDKRSGEYDSLGQTYVTISLLFFMGVRLGAKSTGNWGESTDYVRDWQGFSIENGRLDSSSDNAIRSRTLR